MARRIEAFIFDFGGVFTDSPFAAVQQFGRDIGADPLVVSEIVFGAYEKDGDHPWHRLERGEIALEQARGLIREIGSMRTLDIDIYKLFAKMAENGGGAAGRVALVDRVRQLRAAGFRTGVITNNVREFGAAWRGMMPVDELFEFVVDSCEVGVRKPDRRIFEMALAKLNDIDPARCVFLDDYAANVEAARALGMHAIHVGPRIEGTLDEIDAVINNNLFEEQ